jgi:hypothetical protein
MVAWFRQTCVATMIVAVVGLVRMAASQVRAVKINKTVRLFGMERRGG